MNTRFLLLRLGLGRFGYFYLDGFHSSRVRYSWSRVGGFGFILRYWLISSLGVDCAKRVILWSHRIWFRKLDAWTYFRESNSTRFEASVAGNQGSSVNMSKSYINVVFRIQIMNTTQLPADCAIAKLTKRWGGILYLKPDAKRAIHNISKVANLILQILLLKQKILESVL